MDRITDCDKLQIQELEKNLHHFATWLVGLFFATNGEPSSECYFMD